MFQLNGTGGFNLHPARVPSRRPSAASDPQPPSDDSFHSDDYRSASFDSEDESFQSQGDYDEESEDDDEEAEE